MQNETHDPALTSWIESADGHPDFPLQNLPFAVLRRRGASENFRVAVAIGDYAVDLTALAGTGLIRHSAADALAACLSPSLNAFMALGTDAWSSLRLALSRLLRHGASDRDATGACLVALREVEYALPAAIGDYTDFYASIEHATNIGRLFRPDNPLLPNYEWVPIAYHGRASSIVISGTDVHRPIGQARPAPDAPPPVRPCRQLDYELELGIFIGPGNARGKPIPIDAAGSHVFGCALLNDWSARDIQAWEYQPLGPFLGKSFATSLSPWIVTLEALAPFRCGWQREPGRPPPLDYLRSDADAASGALDITLDVQLLTDRMRRAGVAPQRLSCARFRNSYWTIAQMVSHHTINGCNLRPGDLLGSGTVSGARPDSLGSLMEITRGGATPLELPTGERRAFLEDGDTVRLGGWCEAPGAIRIGFGEVTGTVRPAS